MRIRNFLFVSTILLISVWGCSSPLIENEDNKISEDSTYSFANPEAMAEYKVLLDSKNEEIEVLSTKVKNLAGDQKAEALIVDQVNLVYSNARQEMSDKYGKDWDLILRKNEASSKTSLNGQYFGNTLSEDYQREYKVSGTSPITHQWIWQVIVYGKENIGGKYYNVLYTYLVEEIDKDLLPDNLDTSWHYKYATNSNPHQVENEYCKRYDNAKITHILADDTNTPIQYGIASSRPESAIKVGFGWTLRTQGNAIRSRDENYIVYDGSVFELLSEVSITNTIWTGSLGLGSTYYPTAVDAPVPQIKDSIGIIANNNLYIRASLPNSSWVLIESGVTQFAISENRLGVLMTNGDFKIKEGNLSSNWVVEIESAKQIALSGNRIGVLMTNGDFKIKEGSIWGAWVLEIENAKQIALSGNRIGVLMTNGDFKIKEGSIWGNWVLEIENVKQIALSGNRIGVLLTNGDFKIKEGSIWGNWVLEIENAKQIALSGNRIGVLLTNGDFKIKEGNLYGAWILQIGNVIQVDLSGTTIIVSLTDGDIKIKEGWLWGNWETVKY